MRQPGESLFDFKNEYHCAHDERGKRGKGAKVCEGADYARLHLRQGECIQKRAARGGTRTSGASLSLAALSPPSCISVSGLSWSPACGAALLSLNIAASRSVDSRVAIVSSSAKSADVLRPPPRTNASTFHGVVLRLAPGDLSRFRNQVTFWTPSFH